MKIRSNATLTLRAMLAHFRVAQKIRVWGEPQQAAFVPLVATEALLAT